MLSKQVFTLDLIPSRDYIPYKIKERPRPARSPGAIRENMHTYCRKTACINNSWLILATDPDFLGLKQTTAPFDAL